MMDIKDFFDLPEDARLILVRMEHTRKLVIETRNSIAVERQKLNTRELNNQLRCEHIYCQKTYKAHENEFGNYTGGGVYHYHCDDCGKRWTEEKDGR